MNSYYFKHLEWLIPSANNFRELLQVALAEGSPAETELQNLAKHYLNEQQLYQLGRAFIKARNSRKIGANLTSFRLAVLSNGTTDHLIPALVGTALRYGINLQILGFSYDESYAVAVSGDSRLKEFAPDAVLIAVDYQGLPLREVFGHEDDENQISKDCTDYLGAMYEGVRRHSSAICYGQTIALPPIASFGHADRKTFGSLSRIIDKVNHFISDATDIVLDIANLAAIVGTSQWFDAKLFQIGKIPFTLTFVPLYADHVCRVIGAIRGKSRRVLVLDLDNTLWSGVIGDDGVEGIIIGNGSPIGEAFLAFQRKVLSLRKRGVLLAVSSKNDDEQARRPFREIPDMVLKENSFSAFHANWSDKAANIQAISEELSLGLDTFVFVDDNPHERALVRKFLPAIAVPEMPEDPSCYSMVLDAAGYFESISFSAEDARRADLYQARATIAHLASNDLGAYLETLEMKLIIENITAVNRARVVQLINKSNQFNLTTLRLTDTEVRTMEANSKFFTYALRLTDKFDDHGIISVLICEKLDSTLNILLWVMSCRVIGRGLEKAALSFLTEKAKILGCTHIKGKYIPTARNKLVEKHYLTLGFSEDSIDEQNITTWILLLKNLETSVIPLEIIDNVLVSGLD